jgi:hypothetical protein
MKETKKVDMSKFKFNMDEVMAELKRRKISKDMIELTAKDIQKQWKAGKIKFG